MAMLIAFPIIHDLIKSWFILKSAYDAVQMSLKPYAISPHPNCVNSLEEDAKITVTTAIRRTPRATTNIPF